MSDYFARNIGVCGFLIGASYMASMFSFVYNSSHGSCDENVFIASTVGAVSSVVSACAYAAIAVLTRKEALAVRFLTFSSAVIAASAAAFYVVSDVIINDFVVSGAVNAGGEDPYRQALKLQLISVSIMSCVMAFISMGAFVYGKIMSDKQKSTQKVIRETVV